MTLPKDRPILFLKASSIPDGARWITVHPNGPGSEGSAVLIQPQADGSAHVIGGAGGKLNYLKLRGVRKESEYKKEAEQRKSAKKDAAKEQRAKDKEAGILESKTAAKNALRDQVHAGQRKFIQKVADKLGWDKSKLEFPEADYAHLSDAAQAKLRNQHHRSTLQQAKAVVQLQRERLVADHGARIEGGLGEIPLDSSDPDTLSVQDLSPISSNPGGLGFSQDFKERAEDAGLTDGELKAEAGKAKEAKQATMTEGQRAAAIKRGETATMIKSELVGIREPAAPSSEKTLLDTKDAIELMKEEKALDKITRKARVAAKEIDKSASEPKAFILEYEAVDDAEIAQDLSNDLATAQTMAFLSEFNKIAGDKPEETLGKHIGVGAYNSINSLALAVGGDALVDRSVVDVLGIAGAAQVLARRIHTDMPDDAERITEGVQEFHLHHYMETSAEALGQARELMDAAKEVELGEAASGADLQVAQELNGRRRKAVGDAQKILGQALGEMEANAALVTAMKQGAKDKWQGSLGKIPMESAIQRVRAIGLQRGDYTLDTVAGDTFLTINGAGMDRLAKPINRDDVQQVARNLSIIRGDEDEDGWLPLGVARRPDLNMDAKPGVAARMAEPFTPGGDLEQSLRDYIGGRAADGDAPGDIVADIQSAAFFEKVGFDKAESYRMALDAVAPLKGADGKQARAESLGDKFDSYADKFVESRYGGARSTLNKQQFEVNQTSVDALHRALSENPDGVAAFKQIGELTNQDQRALRDHFYKHVAKESPEQGALRAEVDRLNASEPEKETTDMFGDGATNPEWSDWKAQRDEAAAKSNASGLDWPKYVDAMHGNEKAYEAIQDLIRSDVGKSFADAHNKLNPGKPLKLGRSVIRNNLNHLDATDQKAREDRQARERELTDSLRERTGGRYASGSVSDKLDAARDQDEAFNQAQMGFFSNDEPAPADAPAELKGDERHSLGHVAERQIAGMMGVVGKNFKPGQPTKLWAPTMSGGDNFARQRSIKLVEANKRLGLHLGAGSGKSLVSMAAFTHLQQQGKAKRALFAVPSIVQGQFGGEALRYLEPGKFNWHCEPGASRDERIAAYKNADHHFVVTTHQALRDDLIHLGAKNAGSSEGEMRDKLSSMSRGEHKAWMADVMQKEGINFDFSAVDEGHNLLDRQGKDDSGMSMAIGAMTDNTPYHVSMTADPVRNDDASEVFSSLQKIDPDRYSDRGAFLRRYGADTVGSKDGLKREMSRYFYAHSIQPNVRSDKKEVSVPMSAGQKTAMGVLEKHVSEMRISRMEGKVNIDAAKLVSPGSFEGAPVEQHEAIAKGLQAAIGVVKESAVQRIINEHPDSEKANEVVRQIKARPGKPGIVFTRSLKSVEAMRQKLEAEGMRVVTITGADSSEEKDRKRKMFSPDSGEAQADVLVASDAASTGLNAQRGRWVMQYDTPMTAMAQPLDAMVLTPSGFKEMGSIHEGHLIITPSGDWAPVTGVFPQGIKEIYRVTFSDGASTRCCADHLWVTKSRDDVKKKRDWRVRTLRHIEKTYTFKDGVNIRPVYSVPMITAPVFAHRLLPLSPYVVGALLGDGEFGESHVCLASVDQWILNRVEREIAPLDSNLSKVGEISYRLIGNGTMHSYPAQRHSPVLHAIRVLGLEKKTSQFKYVPEMYFHATPDDRLALIQGLMDTDGTVDKRNGHASFCNTSRHLIDSVVHLVQSLGGVATVGAGKRSVYMGKPGLIHWKVSLSLPAGMNPFSLPRKADIYEALSKKAGASRRIVSVELIGSEQAQCIMVGHESHQYITDDFIVTHNTHAQRQARVHRIGQKNDVELIDLVGDHPSERKARERLSRKYAMRDMMSSPLEQLDDTGVAHYIKAAKAEKETSPDSLF